MFRLVIPILKNTEETKSIEDCGLPINYNDCEIFEVIFYQINAIIKINEDGRDWTEIHSNGENFISPIKTEKLDLLIQDQFKLSNFSL